MSEIEEKSRREERMAGWSATDDLDLLKAFSLKKFGDEMPKIVNN